MRRKCMKQNNQNKGFSLLEVLIAMVILGIIVAPLLHMFVVGARTNSKAREIIRATTAAQNSMEELKAESIGNLLRLINGCSVDENGNPLTGTLSEMSIGNTYEVAQSGSTWVQQTGTNSAIQPSYVTVTNPDGTVVQNMAKSDFSPNAAGSYSLIFKDVTEGRSHYDELITLTAASGKELSNANISSMNQDNCGYFVQAADEVTNAATEYANRNITYRNTAAGASAAVMSETDFLSIMQKTITVDIAKDAANGTTTASVSCEYTVQAGYTASDDRIWAGEGGSVFNNFGKVDTTPLKAVYIYYYPNYTLAASYKDKIIINNTNNLDVAVYLIAMENGVGYTMANAASYSMDMVVNETPVTGETALHTVTCTNLDRTKVSRRSNDVSKVPEIRDLGNSSSEQIYYNVSVKVYKHDNSMFSTDGLGNVVFTPDASKYITEFTGATLDNTATIQ